MQRERLDGWVVDQVQQAGLANRTLLQMPSPSSRPSCVTSPVRRSRALQPCRPKAKDSSPSFEHKNSMLGEVDERASPTWTPSRGMRSPRNFSSMDEFRADMEARRNFGEQSGVDRTQVLRSEEYDDTFDEDDILSLWGFPRDHILAFIRQTIEPSDQFEIRTPPPYDPPSFMPKFHSTVSADESIDSQATLPVLSAHRKQPTSNFRLGDKNPSRPHTSPVQIGTTATPKSRNNDEPRQVTVKAKDKIGKLLFELRSDPKKWAAFMDDVERAQKQEQKRRPTNKIVWSNKRQIESPRAPHLVLQRKAQAEERAQHAAEARARQIEEEQKRFNARLHRYYEHVKNTKPLATNGGVPIKRKYCELSLAEKQLTSIYKRRQAYIHMTFISFILQKWKSKYLLTKEALALLKKKNGAAHLIQRMWRKWKWRHASRQTVIVYTWLRKCLWRLMFRFRCERRIQAANIIRSFLTSTSTGNRESRDFDRVMFSWRHKVVRSQRIAKNFIECRRARLQALSIWWDKIDYERQRREKVELERMVAAAEEKANEWNAMANVKSTRKWTVVRNSDDPGKPSYLSNKSPRGIQGDTFSTFIPHSQKSKGTPSHQDQIRRLTLIHDRLSSMQQLLTPIEIQRLQQQVIQVVRIPKTIKRHLLITYVSTMRSAYMRELTAYQQQAPCVSYMREVHLDDVRAIVQKTVIPDAKSSFIDNPKGPNGNGNASVDATASPEKKSVGIKRTVLQVRPPVFHLFSGKKQREMMEKLIKEGMSQTLEKDPEQFAMVERQRLRREVLESGLSPRFLATDSNSNGANEEKPKDDIDSQQTSPRVKKNAHRRLAFLLSNAVDEDPNED